MPLQNARSPLARNTATRMSSSSRIRFQAAATSVAICSLKLFNRSGRLRVTVATWSVTSNSMVCESVSSGMDLLGSSGRSHRDAKLLGDLAFENLARGAQRQFVAVGEPAGLLVTGQFGAAQQDQLGRQRLAVGD